MKKRLRGTVLIILFPALMGMSLVSQGNAEYLSEVYEKEIIIDTKWGDKPQEFGIEMGSPPIVPGPFFIDEQENVIYILDIPNYRIQKFNTNGEFLGTANYNKIYRVYSLYLVKNDTIFCGGQIEGKMRSDPHQCYLMIFNGANGDLIEHSPFCDFSSYLIQNPELEGTNFIFYISRTIVQENETKGEIPISYTKLEKYKWSIKKETLTCIEEKPNCNSRQATRKFEESVKSKLANHEYDNLAIQGNIYSVELIAKDKYENSFCEIGSGYLTSDRKQYHRYSAISKFDKEGNPLTKIELPLKESLGSNHGGRSYVITNSGDLYYLYSTGKIEIDNWNVKFIPGRIQLMRWTIQNNE